MQFILAFPSPCLYFWLLGARCIKHVICLLAELEVAQALCVCVCVWLYVH
jgi:hypothetical protein